MDCPAGDELGESGDPPDPWEGEETGTFGSWTGPKTIFKKVKEWGMDCECDDSNIGAFIQYSSTLAQTEAEERLIFEWVLKLVTLYVKEDGWDGWETGAATWDWSKLNVGNLWEVPPPQWAVEREMCDMAECGKLEEGVKVQEEEVKEEEEGVKEEVELMKEEEVGVKVGVKEEEGVKGFEN